MRGDWNMQTGIDEGMQRRGSCSKDRRQSSVVGHPWERTQGLNLTPPEKGQGDPRTDPKMFRSGDHQAEMAEAAQTCKPGPRVELGVQWYRVGGLFHKFRSTSWFTQGMDWSGGGGGQ
uniref:Uncharacterized protein n=1 Tax=Eutreptiella gymnastica TaxID=73025 RepID=A0A7S1NUH2_9EUGL